MLVILGEIGIASSSVGMTVGIAMLTLLSIEYVCVLGGISAP